MFDVNATVTVRATGETGRVLERTSRTTLGGSYWLYCVGVGGRCVWLRERELR